MIVLLDTSHDLDVCQQELGCEVGQLLTPLTGFRLRHPDRPWAIDNGAFSGFDEKAFFARLRRTGEAVDGNFTNCKFVCLPDMPFEAQRTKELWEWYRDHSLLVEWPLALVVQDGHESVQIPWDDPKLAAIFIGGSDQWKCSKHSEAIIKVAKTIRRGLWVHVGRINSPNRFQWAIDNNVDSCDGSGIAQYSHMREAIAKRHQQEKLFS